ncbi:PAS domain-containing sensor histidine kinase [Pontibacter flavimaris]|uniref:histidine kinase n=1 Tax=Pontibacter flavimaris TaxID=1797110 RepID=A0A1Q5PHA3_9BACT|nr:PAS domain-containing sensor histidine kinase [Pontibacter flavimaris]OKL41610.1 PAS domain-containing sensor histidine kinase [Pontibacter flavimaris]
MNNRIQVDILEKLIHQTNRIVFSFDVEAGAITFLNKAFSYIWRRTPESVYSNPAIVLNSVHPEDQEFLVNEFHELLQGIIKNSLDFRIILPDRSVKWLQLFPELLVAGDGKRHIAGFLDDITLSQENSGTLEKYAAKKNSVLEILSHDLAGPLANIQALADVLAESTGRYGNAEVSKVIRIIRESSERSVRLIREFVQQEFLESSHAGLQRRRVNLVSKIENIIEQYKEGEDHIQKDIRFTYSGTSFYAFIDENKFMQVINNLFSNAIKFTPDNGVIEINLRDEKDTILVTVKDNGIGIPKHFHAELFDKFTMARREGLRGEPSTGLGMSIIKTIVEWHNGRIWFESKENVGTTFFIELPKD